MRILKSRTAYQKALDGTTLIRFQKLAILGFGFCEAWFFSAVVGGFLYTGTNAEAAHFLRAALIFSLALGFALSKVIGPAVQSQKSSNRAVLICGVLSAVAGCVLTFFPIQET